jgi:hypothetical protein
MEFKLESIIKFMILLIKYPMKLVNMARKFWNEIHDSKHGKG